MKEHLLYNYNGKLFSSLLHLSLRTTERNLCLQGGLCSVFTRYKAAEIFEGLLKGRL